MDSISWEASASTLRMSALPLCYSVAEYCCPMWAGSSYTNLIDTQLHSSMRLISGYLHTIPVSCCTSFSMPYSGNWQHASNHRSSPKLAHACWCLWASTSTVCIPTPSMVRHGTCRHNYAVERGLVVGFCGQPIYCNWPYYPTARFRSPSSHTVSCWTISRQAKANAVQICTNGVLPITFLWLWPATDHEPHSRHAAH